MYANEMPLGGWELVARETNPVIRGLEFSAQLSTSREKRGDLQGVERGRRLSLITMANDLIIHGYQLEPP